MDFFVIDTGEETPVPETTGLSSEITDILNSVRSEEESKYITVNKKSKPKTSKFEIKLNAIAKARKMRYTKYNTNIVLGDLKSHQTNADKLLQKSIVVQPEFDQLAKVPKYDISDKKLKKINKREREKTKGDKWFNMPAPEMTEEVKRDLEVLQMRSVLDPKHFYKKNDLKVLPKYFQIGKVMDSPLDYYNNRLTKKERKKTIVDELLADAEFHKYNKKKYVEIVEERRKSNYKAHMQAKRLKRRNKKQK